MQLNTLARQNRRKLHLAALTSCHVKKLLTDYCIIILCGRPTENGTVHLLMMTIDSVATAQMRICYGSHNKYALKKASYRIPRDHPERGFYKLRPTPLQ